MYTENIVNLAENNHICKFDSSPGTMHVTINLKKNRLSIQGDLNELQKSFQRGVCLSELSTTLYYSSSIISV